MAYDSNYYYYCYYAGDVRVMADACALPERVAAIDFGTGSCSLAYTLGQDDRIAAIPLSSDLDSPRVPTAILLKKNPDSTLRVSKFGILAQEAISTIDIDSMPDEIIYFECFKMELFHDSVSIATGAYRAGEAGLIELLVAIVMCVTIDLLQQNGVLDY